MTPSRFSYDGHGVIRRDGRIIAHDDPLKMKSDDLFQMCRRANLARDLWLALEMAEERLAINNCEGEELPYLAEIRRVLRSAEGL